MKFKDKLNKQYTLISVYVIITAIIIYVLSLMAKNAPIIYSQIMDKVYWLLRIIKPIILGFVFAYLVEPVVDYFEGKYINLKFLRKNPKRGRTYAVFTTLFIVVLVLAGMISMLVFSVTDQLKLANFDDVIMACNEMIKTINEFVRTVMSKLNSLDIESAELSKYVKETSAHILVFIQGLGSKALSSVSNISSYMATVVFAVIIGIYFLIDGRMIKQYMEKVSRALLNEKTNKRIKNIIIDADTVFSGYIRGQLTDAFLMMVIISIILSIVGVKFAVVIGIFSGIGNLIPYCGPFVAYGGTVLVCLINGQYKQMIIGVILLFIVQTIDGNVIGPKLLSKSIKIHPMLIIIFLIFGSAIGGLMGMLLAVPVGAFIKVLFMRFIDRRLKQKEKEAVFSSVEKVNK